MSSINMNNTNYNIPNLEEMSLSLVLGVIVIFIIFLFIVQYCWNNTISVLTKSSEITIWQSFLLLVLFHILFNCNNYYMQK
jgi:hypothetical protein